MGLTKSVQPYCKFAIITMQMMPKISCPQRVASDAVARTPIVLVVVDIFLPSLLVSYFLISFVISYVARRDARLLQIAPLTKPFVRLGPTTKSCLPTTFCFHRSSND